MTSVIIADDHKIFREGLAILLESNPNIRVIAEAGNGYEVLELLKILDPDVLLLDIEMPKLDGFDTLKELKRSKKTLKTLVLTMHNSPEFIRNILKAGAAGYIQKDVDKDTLIKAVFEVAENGTYLDPEISKIIVTTLKKNSYSSELSKREEEIIKLIVDQHTTNEIGEILHISPHTVESHRQNILLKLGLKNTAGLVKYAVQRGIL